MNKKLSDYCINITDGEHGSVEDAPNGEYYLLSNKNIINGEVIITPSDRKISEDSYKKIHKRTKLEELDVLISTVGTLGKLAIVTEKPNYEFQRSVGIIKCDKNKLLPQYLYYYLSLNSLQNRLINNSKGAVQKCIFINDLKELLVGIPSVSLQKLQINLLSYIDKKIKLNNKINMELENIAKTLYDYWFVQFDFPDENKRPYKSSGGSMIYNEILKREIPVNWKVENISKYCNIIDCLHSKKPDYCYEANNLYLLQLENLTNAGYIDITNRYYISKDDYKYWIQKIEIQENDFIFTNAGRTGAFGKIPKDVRCALGRNLTAIRPISISPYYLRMYFGSNDMRQQVLSNLDCGAFFKSFNVKSIKLIALLIPQENILNNFILKISPIIKQIESNNIEIQFLKEIRDFLLPMLMNGQISIVAE